jgi:Na+/proline symporter
VRRPGRFANPVVKRRIAVGVICLGGLLAGIAALLRAQDNGPGSNSGTYLLDVTGWLTVVTGAVLEARASQVFFQVDPAASRRRAIAFVALGVAAALAGCIVASMVADDDSPVALSAGAMFVLVAGAGFGLAGLFSLGASHGADYAARRIANLGEEDW